MRGGGFGVPGQNGGDFPPPGEMGGPPDGGLGASAPAGGRFHGGCAPHFLFETSKRKCAAPGGKEKMFGGSVCASADLLPPAGEGWLSRAAVRDGNAPPLGKPPQPGAVRDTLSDSPRCRSRFFEEQPAAAKREAAQCVNHPDAVGTIRHGTPVSTS